MEFQIRNTSKKIFEYFDKEHIWTLILFPGFISYFTARYISNFENINAGEQAFYLIGFTIVNTILIALTLKLKNILNIVFCRIFRRTEKPGKKFIDIPFLVFCVLIYSVLIGYTTGTLIKNKDSINLYLWKKGIIESPNLDSEKRPLVKLLFENDRTEISDGRTWKKTKNLAWVRVHLRDNQIFEGWPKYYTLSEKPGELYLSPVCAIMPQEKRSFRYHRGPGILIYENQIKYIEFIDDFSSACCIENEKKIDNKDRANN